MKNAHKKLVVLCVIMSILAIVSVLCGCYNAVKYPMGSFDFQYDSAKLLFMRINPYEESLNPTGLQTELGMDTYYGRLEANKFPSMLIFLFPYVLLKPMTANWTWMISNLLFTAGSLFLLKFLIFDDTYAQFLQSDHMTAAHFSARDGSMVFWLIACLMMMGTPWRNNIGNGQHTIMAFFFFLLSLRLSKINRIVLSGLSLSISYFKYTLTVPMALFFVYKKKYKELIVSIAVHVVLTFASAIWLKASILDMIILPLKVSSNLSGAGSYDISATFRLGRVGMPIAAIALLSILVYCAIGKFKGSDNELLSILTMISLVIVYHRGYDFFVLILPLVIYTFQKQSTKAEKMASYCIWGCVIYVFFVEKAIITFLPSIHASISVLFSIFFYITIAVSGIAAIRREQQLETS